MNLMSVIGGWYIILFVITYFLFPNLNYNFLKKGGLLKKIIHIFLNVCVAIFVINILIFLFILF